MKKILLSLIACLCGLNVNGQTNFPIFRVPPISPAFSSNMAVWDQVARSQAYPRSLIKQEGKGSDSSSSAQGVQDYFVIYAPSLPDGGIILTMYPLLLGYGGILSRGIYFTDVINRVDYYVSLDYWTLTGSFNVAGQTIWVKVSYDQVPRLIKYPYVQLTWGDGAGFGDVGTIYDDLSFAVVINNPPLTKMALALANHVGITDVPDGIYVFVNAPDEYYTLQSTTDFKTWADEPKPFYILGYVGIHYYPSGAGNKFFRSKR